jgi:hypothetical protein
MLNLLKIPMKQQNLENFLFKRNKNFSNSHTSLKSLISYCVHNKLQNENAPTNGLPERKIRKK